MSEFYMILSHVGLGMLGVLVVVYGKFLTSARDGGFSFKLFWKENKMAMISTLIGLPLILVVILLVPQASEMLKMMIGLDMDITKIDNGSAFTLGVGLYSLARNANKKPAKP